MSADERAELIEQLDPDRDYGDLSHSDIVHAVETNKIKIFRGITVPVLRDSRGLSIRGSGTFPLTNEQPQEWTVKRFRQRFVEDFDAVYAATLKAALGGEPRAQKLLLDHGLGRPQQAADRALPELLMRLLEVGWQSYPSSEVYTAEARDVSDEINVLGDGTPYDR